MALNQNLQTLKAKLSRYCSNNLFDNSAVIDYINKIDERESGTDYEKSLKAILSLDLDYFDGDDNYTKLIDFVYKFNLFKEILKDIRNTVDADIDNYKSLKNNGQYSIAMTEKLFSASITSLELLISNLKTSFTTSDDAEKFNKYLSNFTNTISTNLNITYTTEGIKAYEINDEDDIKNHVFMMVSMTSPNEKSQLFALKKLFEMIEKFIKLYVFSKSLKLNGNSADVCSYFNNIRDEFPTSDIINQSDIQNMYQIISFTGMSYDQSTKQLTKVNQTVSTTLTNLFEKSPDEILVLYDNRAYQVQTFKKTVNSINSSNYNIEIELKEKLVNQLSNSDPGIEIKIIESNNKESFKRKFLETGKELRLLNGNILDSKNKINYIYEKSTAQTEILNSLDTFLVIYYICIAIIIAIYIALIFISKSQIKQYGTIGAFIIALSMNISNQFLPQKSIVENFTTDIQCNQTDTTRKKIDFIQQKIAIFMDYFEIYIDDVQSELNSLDVTNVFTQIYGLMENEKKAFIEHDKVYKYKTKMGRQGIDIIKQDIIERIAYMYLISSCILIVTIVFLLYLFAPQYVSIYITIAVILIIYLLTIYYYKIIQVVNTKSSNKYWTNISETTMEKLS